MQAGFDSDHEMWQLHLPGMQQHRSLVTPGAPSLPRGPPAYRLGAGEC